MERFSSKWIYISISGFTITGGTGIYTSDGEGGGIYIGLVSGGPVIDNCIETGNSEGAFFFKGESTIMNTLIHGNDKSFTHYTTTTLLKNCTFVNQSAGSYLGDNVNLTYLNCIVMDENISSSGGSPSILNVSYSLFENGASGQNRYYSFIVISNGLVSIVGGIASEIN